MTPSITEEQMRLHDLVAAVQSAARQVERTLPGAQIRVELSVYDTSNLGDPIPPVMLPIFDLLEASVDTPHPRVATVGWKRRVWSAHNPGGAYIREAEDSTIPPYKASNWCVTIFNHTLTPRPPKTLDEEIEQGVSEGYTEVAARVQAEQELEVTPKEMKQMEEELGL